MFRMNLKQWLLLLSDCRLDVTKARAEIVFKQCLRDGRACKKPEADPQCFRFRVHQSAHAELDGMAIHSRRGMAGRPRGRAEDEKDLGYAEFVNALVHLGWDHIAKSARAKAQAGGPATVRTTVGMALWNLVEDEIRPVAGHFDGCISLRTALEEQPAKGVLAKALGDAGTFGRAFKTYHDAKTGHMLLSGFDLWARHSGLLTIQKLSVPQLRECFIWAGDKDRGRAPEGWYPSSSLREDAQVFVAPDYSMDEKLNRGEFAMACARIAYIIAGGDGSEVTSESVAAAITMFPRGVR